MLRWNYRADVPKEVNTRFAGVVVGYRSLTGLQVRYNGTLYMVHRLIYVIIYGDCLGVEDEVDHADLNNYNNRPNNLRKATRTQNMANREAQRNSKTGIKGVGLLPNGTWRVRIDNTHLGCFKTKEEAAAVYRAAATQIYGKFGRGTSLQKQI